MQSADKLTLEPVKQVYSTSKMLMRWLCARELYAKSGLSDHARSPTVSEPPTDRLRAFSQPLLALFLPTCPQSLSLEAALYLLCRHRAPYFSLSLVSIYSHGPSCGSAAYCGSLLAHCLRLCHCHDWMLATTLWLLSQRQGQDLSPMRVSFMLTWIPPPCWSQSRMKVGRSKTAARMPEGHSSQVCSCQHMQRGCVMLWLCMVYLASSRTIAFHWVLPCSLTGNTLLDMDLASACWTSSTGENTVGQGLVQNQAWDHLFFLERRENFSHPNLLCSGPWERPWLCFVYLYRTKQWAVFD